MYYTQIRKPRYDPRLLSFSFDVMADQIEQLREESDTDADMPQPVAQSPEQFLSGHLLVGTVPPPVEPEQVSPVSVAQDEPWPFYQSIPTAITITHIGDETLAVSGSGINSGPISATLEQLPGAKKGHNYWAFPADSENMLRKRLSWALTPKIERGPDGLVGEDGRIFSADELAHTILPAMTKLEIARLYLQDNLEGATKNTLIQGLVNEARENENERRKEQDAIQTSVPHNLSVDDDPIIRDIFSLSSGALSALLAQEGFEIRNYENLGIVRESWVNSQRSSPEFENWQYSWNHYKRSGLFRSVANSVAAREKSANGAAQDVQARSYDPEQHLAELKAERAQVEQDALRAGRMPVFDARLNESIAKLERLIEKEREDLTESPAEVLGQSEFAQRAREQYEGWKKAEEAKPNVLRFVKEGEPNSRYHYHTNEMPEGYQLVRALLNPHVGSLTQVFYDDDKWHITSSVPREVKPFVYRDVAGALFAAEQDARERGLVPEHAEKLDEAQSDTTASQEDSRVARVFASVGMEPHPTQQDHYTWRNIGSREDARVSAVLKRDGTMQHGREVPWEVYLRAPIGSATDVPAKRFATAGEAAAYAGTFIEKFKRELSAGDEPNLPHIKAFAPIGMRYVGHGSWVTPPSLLALPVRFGMEGFASVTTQKRSG